MADYVTTNALPLYDRKSLGSKLIALQTDWSDFAGTDIYQLFGRRPGPVPPAAAERCFGARPVGNDQQFQMNVQTQGTLTTPQ